MIEDSAAGDDQLALLRDLCDGEVRFTTEGERRLIFSGG
jgi:hypothetical protein